MSPLIVVPALVLVYVLPRTAYVAAAPRDGVVAASAEKGTAKEIRARKGMVPPMDRLLNMAEDGEEQIFSTNKTYGTLCSYSQT